MADIKFYNSLSKKIEIFKPIKENVVGVYTCGPTVYHFAHIGNMRTYVFEDLLKRVLIYNDYEVKHVMNITDVGHLTDDADLGEDKIEKGARREGKTAWEVADFYTEAFLKDSKELLLLLPSILSKATDHIPEQIAFIEVLTKKGYTYETSDGIYFDTTKVDDYGKLVDLKEQDIQAGARIPMGKKKHPHDFALWKFTAEGTSRHMEWKAFGKRGFPGWHIECSAMSIKYLGNHFDIHCGGVDHKPIHHTNEIAQSEAYTGKKPWVNVWLHGEFLNIKTDTEGSVKMAKSGDNFITIESIKEKNLSPLSFRFWLLMGHYRTPLNFNWDALEGADTALKRLYELFRDLGLESGSIVEEYASKFHEYINDDLDMPRAVTVLWDLLKNQDIPPEDRRTTALKFDEVLGLNLINTEILIPSEISSLLKRREQARGEEDWAEADAVRKEIQKMGYEVKDTKDGQKIYKI